MKRIGEFLGMSIYIDPRLRPGAARLVSLRSDPISERMVELDNVPIENLAIDVDDLAAIRLKKPPR